MRKQFVLFSIISVVLTGALAHFIWVPLWWFFIVLGPIVLWIFYDMYQAEHTIVRNFPIFGRGRYIMEALRPKIYQYFIESDIDGTPINRIFRSVIYQRAKGDSDTVPFGTEFDVYKVGYEWMNHSLAAHNPKDAEVDLRVRIGGPDCTKPYSSSILNISAMSYGALSKNAVLALNGGARIGHFAHNTGEGSISPYHLEPNGDLIWQIGTGYFGCRNKEGQFFAESFVQKAQLDAVKMIEIKLSQGAKPGHGGILPAGKNTPEIAQIRTVEPHTEVLSPPTHTAFSNPLELMDFIAQLRELSGGKPIGFKLCIGRRSEFIALCNSARGMMLALGCIQALECNKNSCPTGITTQNPNLMAGLVVKDKEKRIASFHYETVKSVAELLTTAGIDDFSELNRSFIFRRVSTSAIACYDEIYPYPETGCLVQGEPPQNMATAFAEATADSFKPV